MMDHENNAHITSTRSVSFDIDQWDLDALNALVHWLDALEKFGGKGRIPGHFQLLMMYRTIVAQLNAKNV